MDIFGIGAAVRGAVAVYFQSARGTGRTQNLVENLRDGDRVVFLDEREGRRVSRMCLERGVAIEVVVNDPRDPSTLFLRPTPSGQQRTIFDHSWVEAFHTMNMDRSIAEIDKLQRELSGKGAPHEKTAQRAREAAKWVF